MVLFSQMYLFIRKVLLKREAPRCLKKNPPIPHPLRALESFSSTSKSRWLFGDKVPTAHIALSAAFYALLLATALWTNLESVSNGPMNILIPECCYSLKATALWRLQEIGNGAMNVLRWWQLRDETSANTPAFEKASVTYPYGGWDEFSLAYRWNLKLHWKKC